MDKIWLKHYPAGVPAEVKTDLYPSLVALLEESFRKYRNLPAYKFMGRTITFGQVDDLSRAFAAWLQAQGLARGDRVAIMMPNVPQYPVAVAAILRAGYVVVNVNPLYTPRELEHQLKDSGAKADRHRRELRRHPAAGDRRGADQEGGAGRDGRHARPAQGRAGQPRGAQGEEDGAAVFAARRGALQRRGGAGPRQGLHRADASGPTTSRCCSTPAAPPA